MDGSGAVTYPRVHSSYLFSLSWLLQRSVFKHLITTPDPLDEVRLVQRYIKTPIISKEGDRPLLSGSLLNF